MKSRTRMFGALLLAFVSAACGGGASTGAGGGGAGTVTTTGTATTTSTECLADTDKALAGP